MIQYILIKRHFGLRNEEKQHSFKYFEDDKDLIAYVSNMSKGIESKMHDKVHKIVAMDHTAKTKEMTISFSNGILQLVEVEPVPLPESAFEDRPSY